MHFSAEGDMTATARFRLNKVLVVLTLVWVVAPAAQAGTTVTKLRIKGDTVTATFEEVDRDNSCLLNFVTVTSAERIEKMRPDGRTEDVRTVLSVTQLDICTGEKLFDGAGLTSTHAFTVAGDLHSAELTATVTLFNDLSGTTSDFQVNLTWEATTKAVITNIKESIRDRELGIRIKSNFKSRMREAVATGTVVGIGRNFTREPSDEATIQRQNSGTKEITRSF
jgi:hypothetical protein